MSGEIASEVGKLIEQQFKEIAGKMIPAIPEITKQIKVAWSFANENALTKSKRL